MYRMLVWPRGALSGPPLPGAAVDVKNFFQPWRKSEKTHIFHCTRNSHLTCCSPDQQRIAKRCELAQEPCKIVVTCHGKNPPHSGHFRAKFPFHTSPLPSHLAHRRWIIWPFQGSHPLIRLLTRNFRTRTGGIQSYLHYVDTEMMVMAAHNSFAKFPGADDERNACCNGARPDLWPNFHRPWNILLRCVGRDAGLPCTCDLCYSMTSRTLQS